MAPQLRVYVPPHPVIRHWLTIAREKHTPVPLFRTAMNEMGKWLTYEAIREFLPVQEVTVETPLASATGQLIDGSIPLAFVPILRAGLSMLEGCQTLLPTASVYHLGLVRNEETLEASCYLDRLPKIFEPQTRVFIVEPMMATGGSIITTLKLLTERGVDASHIRIINALCAPPALQLINQQFSEVQIYSGCIDEVVNEKGWIVPGLGDAGDRSFGTF
ncbi:uracil phosphoribosyltransferase [Pseudanabaena biceps]|nr:uracil phosphoribosyltransferase [Pseudanabaena biceps]